MIFICFFQLCYPISLCLFASVSLCNFSVFLNFVIFNIFPLFFSFLFSMYLSLYFLISSFPLLFATFCLFNLKSTYPYKSISVAYIFFLIPTYQYTPFSYYKSCFPIHLSLSHFPSIYLQHFQCITLSVLCYFLSLSHFITVSVCLYVWLFFQILIVTLHFIKMSYLIFTHFFLYLTWYSEIV